MIVLSMIYPCNFGCPMCPYTDSNSKIRRYYHERSGDLFPEALWNRIAAEAGRFGSWLRCTGGGEPMLHPRMVEMIESAKSADARVWLNTNGSMFGPTPSLRDRLDRIIAAGIDLIEFSMDAADAATYAVLRPPRGGPPRDPAKWFGDKVDGVVAALERRRQRRAPTRVVVSIIRQGAIEGKLDDAIRFWTDEIGVDEVITRKFLSWDDNTHIPLGRALDRGLYHELPTERKEPCVWPFERLNVDTLGRIALCGQDISFTTAALFPNAWDSSIEDIWQGETFDRYRRMHLAGRGAECRPCHGCSAWLAGVRDWDYGWLQVLEKSGDRLLDVTRRDPGAEVKRHPPKL